MKYSLVILIAFICSCASEEKLQIVSKQETIKRILNGEAQQFKFASYRNQYGEKLSEEESNELNEGKRVRRYFQTSKKEIKEVWCFPKTEDDIFYELRLSEFLTRNPIQEIIQMPIDCRPENIDSLYDYVIEIDQGTRMGTIQADSVKNDNVNQKIIVSMIEQCGFPKDEESVLSAWYTIQHSGHSGLMEYYYPNFKASAANGVLKKSKLASMEDRILMHHALPQLYGTQLVGGSKSSDGELNTLAQTFGFHPIHDVKNVNRRRDSVGLKPIEGFAEERGFEFKPNEHD